MPAKKLADPNHPMAFVVFYRRDFHSAPVIIAICASEDGAIDLAWEQAKKKFRYTGPKRNDYNHFDQSIRVESYLYYE